MMRPARWIGHKIAVVFMVNFMWNRLIFTGEMPSDEERRKYL